MSCKKASESNASEGVSRLTGVIELLNAVPGSLQVSDVARALHIPLIQDRVFEDGTKKYTNGHNESDIISVFMFPDNSIAIEMRKVKNEPMNKWDEWLIGHDWILWPPPQYDVINIYEKGDKQIRINNDSVTIHQIIILGLNK